MYKLISKEGNSVTIDKNILRNSGLMQVLMEESECTEIELNLPHKFLLKSIEYLQYIDKNSPSKIPIPIKDITLKTVLSEWELDFVNNLNEENLFFQMIEAARYLDIKSLIELCSAKIASLIKYKTSEEIKEFLNKM